MLGIKLNIFTAFDVASILFYAEQKTKFRIIRSQYLMTTD